MRTATGSENHWEQRLFVRIESSDKGGDKSKSVTQSLPHRWYDESEEQNRKNEPNLLEISYIF